MIITQHAGRLWKEGRAFDDKVQAKILEDKEVWRRKLHPKGDRGSKKWDVFHKVQGGSGRHQIVLQFHIKVSHATFRDRGIVRHMFKCWAHKVVFLVHGKWKEDWESKAFELRHEADSDGNPILSHDSWEKDIDAMDLEPLYKDNPRLAQQKKIDLKTYFKWTGQSSTASP